SVRTSPTSDAEQDISCDGAGVPSQLGVLSSTAEKADTGYVVTVTAHGPVRWLAAVSALPPQ
ncbi:MAG: hypothetical protein WCD35_11025, partial [Mycobacteriales bacterium]